MPDCLPASRHTMGECLRFLDAASGPRAGPGAGPRAGPGASGSSPSSGSSAAAGGGGSGGIGAGLTPLPLSFSSLAASRAKALHACTTGCMVTLTAHLHASDLTGYSMLDVVKPKYKPMHKHRCMCRHKPSDSCTMTCAQAMPQDCSVLTSGVPLQERQQQAWLQKRVHQAGNQWSFDVA